MTLLVEPSRALPLIGPGVDRVDGPLKVTGAAHYPGDFSYPNMAHAVLVQSTVAAGKMSRIDTKQAEAAPGVLAVITYKNAPRLGRGPATLVGAPPPPPLQDDRILYYGQQVAVVVAETFEQATAAASLVEIDYDRSKPLLNLDDPQAEHIEKLDEQRGNVAEALAKASVRIEATYTTPDETNNPLGLFATVAVWNGNILTIHDVTQWPDHTRTALAAAFGIPKSSIRVLAPFVGGGFGAGTRVWPHVVLTALAARQVQRPVKFVLTRPQMFNCIGHRAATVQPLKIGATREGDLVAIEHEGTEAFAMEDIPVPAEVIPSTAVLYTCPNLSTRDRRVQLNVPSPWWMRGPGETPGSFALESAIDELSYKIGMDPLELHLRNYAAKHPHTGKAWASNALRACYEQGAAHFGWAKRIPQPRSMHAGRLLVGYGMAGAYFPYNQFACHARAELHRDGTAHVCSAATDIGPGTTTVTTQVAAFVLGLPLERVLFRLGDTDMPPAPVQGGSNLTASLGSAVQTACQRLIQAFLDLVHNDPASPLRGCKLSEVTVSAGRISRTNAPEQSETYTEILARHALDQLSADGEIAEYIPDGKGGLEPAIFGAKFAEVHVDPDLGLVRVARLVSAIDGGRIINEKTATSQIIGGSVWGIGMALLEQTVSDSTGRIANGTFSQYLVPVNADVPDMEVIFVGQPDPTNPLGVKGIGEIGLVGVAAAIANAVYHATGRRVRDLPITLEKVFL